MKNISFFSTLLFIIFYTLNVCANNQDSVKTLIGNYEGELIYPNGDKLSINTEVYLNDSGNLEGKYSFNDFGGEEIHGNLSNFEIKATNKMLVKWRDVYGRGWLEVNLFDGKFNGTWGVMNNEVFEKTGDWNGKKINYEEKLVKLKSLYEKKLITKKEYDLKRKEILDKMF